MILASILDFYKNQGDRTKVVKGTFNSFPKDIQKLCRIIQGLLIHPGTIKKLYNLNFSKSRVSDKSIKTIQELLNKAIRLDNSPLTTSREPRKRVVAICKHFSMLLCSILREKGIPARTRCGFATYFKTGFFEDHWICEYWNSNKKRWVCVDPQIDDIQAVAYRLDRDKIDFMDLPHGVFFPAGILWKLYREGYIDSKVAGFSLRPNNFGEWYIRGNMLRDFFALNKIEYSYSEENILMEKDRRLSSAEFKLLDKISEYTAKPDGNFKEFRKLYLNNRKLLPK